MSISFQGNGADMRGKSRLGKYLSRVYHRKGVQHFWGSPRKRRKGDNQGRSKRKKKKKLMAVMKKPCKVGGAGGTDGKQEWTGRE